MSSQRKGKRAVPDTDVWERVKWNGWGEKGVEFGVNANGNVYHSRTGIELPKLLPFCKDILQIEELDDTPSVDVDSIELPEPRKNEPFMNALRSFLGERQISAERLERLCHTYGSSLRDLWRLRKGIISEAVDVVVYPHSHEDVEKIVAAAHAHSATLIPCGGRTNIVGAVEPEASDNRLIVSLDTRRMNKLLWLDKKSNAACFEVGILGPDLEAILTKEGYALGHDPDSFQWSTLGGWLATCSSGMQSDKYGDIEDMCLSVKVVTPMGTITTPMVPRNGSGPTIKHFFVGSEGTLGVLTQAVMRVHPLPEVRTFSAFLYPEWENGVSAIHAAVKEEASPAMIRLYDADETQLSFSMRPATGRIATLISDAIKGFLERYKGFDLKKVSMMIVGYEGPAAAVKQQQKQMKSVAKRNKGFPLGSGPGHSWYDKRYDLPLLRDLLLDHGLWVDVAESSMTWSNVLPLWRDVKNSLRTFFAEKGMPCFVGAHISHTYGTGVCVYFHFASVQRYADDGRGGGSSEEGGSTAVPPDEDMRVYTEAKRLATQAILRNNGALSHHHGVGFEHLPFMAIYHDPTSLFALRTLKASLDPKNICNPGKLLPPPGKEASNHPEHLFSTRGLQIDPKTAKL